MKYLLLATLFLVGCSSPIKDVVYLVQAPGIMGPNMTYLCEESYGSFFKNCTDTIFKGKVETVYSTQFVVVKKVE